MVTANFQATTSADSITAQWWIEIEGIRRRYGSVVPTWAVGLTDAYPDRIIRDYFETMPEFRAQEAEPLNGSTKPHEFTVRIVDVNDELTDLFSVHDDTCGIAYLTVAATAAAVNITVDDASVFTFPCDIFVNRETMRCTNIAGNVLTVVRGVYGSEAVAHPLTDENGNPLPVMVADKPRFMHTREVVLYEDRVGLVEADAIAFRGYLLDIQEDQGVWVLQCPGFLRRLSCKIGETLAETELESALCGFLDPETPYHPSEDEELYTTWCMKVLDPTNFQASGHVKVGNEIIKYVAKTAIPRFLYMQDPTLVGNVYDREIGNEGRGVFSYEIFGTKGILTDYVHYHDNQTGQLVYKPLYRPALMEAHSVGAKVQQVIHSDDFTAGVDPAAVILQLLTSTGTGLNGAYDTLPKGWGAGIPQAKVDSTGIVEICKLIPYILYAPFCIPGPTDLKEWLEENILRPCHLFFIETPDGEISVRRLWSKQEAQAYTTPTTIDHDVLLEIPEFTMGDPPIGEITIKINWDPGGDKFYGKIHFILGDGRDRYGGTARNFEIECKTVYDPRVPIGGDVWRGLQLGGANQIMQCYLGPIWENYSLNPCPKVSIEIPYNRYVNAYVGHVFRLTSTVTPDLKNSVRGLSSEWFQIVKAEPNPEKTSIEIEAWMIGVHDDTVRQLAPSAKVKSYTDPSPAGAPAVRVGLEDSEFTDSVAGYLYDVDGFAVNDVVNIIDSQYRPKVGAPPPETATIVDTGRGMGVCWVDFAAAPANPPGAGDFISTARYDDCQATQKSTWAYLADVAETLGAANDPAHERER